MLIVLKIVVVIAFLLVLFLLVQTAKYGRRARTDLYMGDRHMCYAIAMIIMTFIAVLLVEGVVVMSGTKDRPPLFWLHLPFALAFLLLSLLLLWKNGSRTPRLHRPMAWTSAGCYAVTFVTGMFLLAWL